MPLADVTLSLGGQTAKSGADGFFLLRGVAAAGASLCPFCAHARPIVRAVSGG